MRIGIDFDNTIVNYDGIFHHAGTQLGWIPEGVGKSKQAVKTWFIEQHQEPKWTELQGIVYGKAIHNASPYEHVAQVLDTWCLKGYELVLVSHKTQFPIIGEKLDFHAAAKNWLNTQQLSGYFSEMYFCPEKAQKIAKISQLKPDYFIDDLPSILTDPNFPKRTRRVLFGSPSCENESVMCVESWSELIAL